MEPTLLKDNSKYLLKKFFELKEAKQLVNTNDYESLFNLWSRFVSKTPHDGLCFKADLSYLLTTCGVDYLSHMSTIPNYLFWYWPSTKRIYIPRNIESIGDRPFKFSEMTKDPAITLIYDGTKEELLNKTTFKSLLKSLLYRPKSILVKCTDGDLLNRESEKKIL